VGGSLRCCRLQDSSYGLLDVRREEVRVCREVLWQGCGHLLAYHGLRRSELVPERLDLRSEVGLGVSASRGLLGAIEKTAPRETYHLSDGCLCGRCAQLQRGDGRLERGLSLQRVDRRLQIPLAVSVHLDVDVEACKGRRVKG
jgi:hypothetical protein